VAEAANGLVARGHRVTVAVPLGAPVCWPLTADLVRVPALSPECLPGADVILPTFYTTLPAAIASGRPVIRFSLGFEPLWVPDPEVALAGYLLPHPIITISHWLQQLLLQRTGRSSHIVHPGVDRAVFFPRGNKGALASPSIAFILRGAGYSYKGTAVFWQAMSIIHRQRPDIKLLIVANDEAADPGVRFPHLLLRAPGDAELSEILGSADVFVFPSLFEGFGLPPLEAMACGTAVVCTDSGGVRDYARHGVNCLLVPPGTVAPLAQAILRLMSDAPLRHRLVANGLRTASEWSWQRMYDGLHQFVVELAGGMP
jgi:glycosyltransferase involved in cell wall biosynthesis